MKRTTALFLIGLGITALCAAQTPSSVQYGIFRQEGIASWYGAEFAGRPTASGETFNPNQLTAAHPTLPFGTLLKITNKHNNKQVTVRVNDRGPFVSARIIDLSQGAAAQLDMISTGTAPVIVESVDAISFSPTPAPANSSAPAAAPAPNRIAAQVPRAESGPATTQSPMIAQRVITLYDPELGGPLLEPLDGLSIAAPAPAAQPTPPPVVPQPPPSTAVPVAAVQPTALPALPPAAVRPAIPPVGTGKLYRIQVGSYKIPRYAVDAFDKLKNAGLSPSYERNGEFYRVVLAGVRADDVQSIAGKLGTAGFAEVIIREEQ
jgi:rare lipoprotein A